MFKILGFLLVGIFLFSCNGLSDEEMEIRLAELELIQLANEHLEEDIDGLIMGIDAKMALPSNKPTIGPLAEKYDILDSVCNYSFNLINSKTVDYLEFATIVFNKNLLKVIGKDSLNQIHFFNQTYFDSTIAYKYSQLKAELYLLHNNQLNFITSLNSPSELEWKEIIELSKSYILVSKKRTLNYLLHLYVDEKHSLNYNHLNVNIDLEKYRFKPNENITLNIGYAIKYVPNYSLMLYYYDDSLIYDKTNFNKLCYDDIYVPTSELGTHTIHGSKFFRRTRKDTLKNNHLDFTFTYEVIENK